MTSEILLLHRQGSSGFEFGVASDRERPALHQLFLFNTCMRKIAVFPLEDLERVERFLKAGDEIYRGEEAYRFLLQTICGLRSPLIGETEVAGQFRNTVGAYQLPATPFGRELGRAFKNLFEDAKRVRQAHLVDLGSQSYGSILRREMKGLRRVHIVGAGHLAQEILPWLAKEGARIHIHARSPEKARHDLASILKACSGVSVRALDECSDLVRADGLIIAAPVASSWIQEWVPQDANPAVVADLRGDWREDALSGFGRVLGLGELVERISCNRSFLEQRKSAALIEIDQVVLERRSYVEYRPFGWEDVCA
jgi:glutamyl-tRNA reductase